MKRRNRISRYMQRSTPRARYQKAERDLEFVEFMVRLGFDYTASADRMVKRAAKHKAAALKELGK